MSHNQKSVFQAVRYHRLIDMLSADFFICDTGQFRNEWRNRHTRILIGACDAIDGYELFFRGGETGPDQSQFDDDVRVERQSGGFRIQKDDGYFITRCVTESVWQVQA